MLDEQKSYARVHENKINIYSFSQYSLWLDKIDARKELYNFPTGLQPEVFFPMLPKAVVYINHNK